MAERRMFAKTIIDSDAFLDMPLTTQALYFHLAMRADDEGFINNPKKIMRMIGASQDELSLLIAKSFIIPFESGIVVIKHWKIHNYLRSDRFKPTVCIEEKSMLSELPTKEYILSPRKIYGIPSDNQVDTSGIPSDNQLVDTLDTNGIQTVSKMDTQDRLGKDRLGKDREEIVVSADAEDRPSIPYDKVKDLYNSICKSLPACKSLSDARKKAIKARFNSGRTLADFEEVFRKTEASSFLTGGNDRNWQANFDWLIKDANMAKVLDGNYDERPERKPRGKGYRYKSTEGPRDFSFTEAISEVPPDVWKTLTDEEKKAWIDNYHGQAWPMEE